MTLTVTQRHGHFAAGVNGQAGNGMGQSPAALAHTDAPIQIPLLEHPVVSAREETVGGAGQVVHQILVSGEE